MQGIMLHGKFEFESVIPDYAARKFAEDARRRARRRTLVLQVPDKKADSVKLRAPCGFKCLRIYHRLIELHLLGEGTTGTNTC